MMAAIYGYPKTGRNLPGLVQIHGGGQYADYRAVIANAKRGYATISISWAGRINAPGYTVNHDIVKLFFEQAVNDPEYKITTDWGAVDGYHDPCRNSDNSFVVIPVASWTIDSIKSPRNNSWFLCTIGARRALTFLEQQSEVNPGKLGVYGHSMGGKLTVLTTGTDTRVKVAAPSCGGISDRYNEDALFRCTLGDDAYLKNIYCPIIFLSPSNDFHGRINDLQKAITEINSENWHVVCSAHHNHQDTPEFMVTGLLWFDQYLKGTFKFPKTPESTLDLKTKKKIPIFSVTPDNSKQIVSVDIYYTQQVPKNEETESSENAINRFWYCAKSKHKNGIWSAELPVLTTDKPVWVYANVLYQLEEPVTGAGYYYEDYTANTFNLSSKMHIIAPESLKESGIKITLTTTEKIESFDQDWEKEWFTFQPENWPRRTHKVFEERWKAHTSAKLVFQVKSRQDNLLVVGIDNYATEIPLKGNSGWQKIELSHYDFKNGNDETLSDWDGIKELRLESKKTWRVKKQGKETIKSIGGTWNGSKPEFKNMKWSY